MAVWTTILKEAPALLAAADALLARSRATAATAASDDAQATRARIAVLEQQLQAQADLVKQLVEQVGALTAAAQAGARKAQHGVILGAGGVGLALVAVILALL